MKWTKPNIIKDFDLRDYLSIVVVLFGSVLIFAIEEFAIKLIGFSISILGLLYFVASYSQKRKYKSMRTTISEPGAKPPNYSVKKLKDDRTSERQQIQYFEDLDDSLEEESESERGKPTKAFRVVGPVKRLESESQGRSEEVEVQSVPLTENQEKKDANFVSGGRFSADHLQIHQEIKQEDKITTEQVEQIGISPPQTIEEVNKNNEIEIVPTREEEVSRKQFSREQILKEFDSSVLPGGFPQLPQDPRKEFRFFITLLLKAIRSISNTQSSAFLYVNFETKELVLEAIDTSPEISQFVKPNRRFKLADDIVSQIILQGKPEILRGIEKSAEMDLLPFYTEPVGMVSFIGIPVFYRNHVAGILCASSQNEDVYDFVTVNFLIILSKVISNLLQSYEEKNELFQSKKLIIAINKYRELLQNRSLSEENIADILLITVGEICDYVTAGICCYDKRYNSWVVKYLNTKDRKMEALKHQKVEIYSSLVGQILGGTDTIYASPELNSKVRIYNGEPNFADGFFVAISLRSTTHVYGALFVNGQRSSDISKSDIEVLKSLCTFTGLLFEEIFLNAFIENNAIIDSQTGIYNSLAFSQRLEEEFYRAKDFGYPLALCVFQVDKYVSYKHIGYNLVINHILKIVREHLKPYFVLGRIDENTFGIIIPTFNYDELKPWGEGLRSKIAVSALQIDKERFFVTISMGISIIRKAENIQDLLNNSQKALEVSKKKTNSITLYT